jgi:hypothetical protein
MGSVHSLIIQNLKKESHTIMKSDVVCDFAHQLLLWQSNDTALTHLQNID